MLSAIIPAYVYSEYQDDDDILAFNIAFNTLAQSLYSQLLGMNLPLYPNLTLNLLDWVASNLYGYPRPTIATGSTLVSGAFNTYGYNDPPAFGDIIYLSQGTITTVTDDIYIRCIAWHHFKGDGKQMTLEWLKRRIVRFVWGQGSPATGNYFTNWDFDAALLNNVSITFGVYPDVNINFVRGTQSNLKASKYDGFAFNTYPFNYVSSTFVTSVIPALASTFAAAVECGVLEMPFERNFIVNL